MTLDEALWQDPKRMSGAVCFRDTWIPVSILFDYIMADELVQFYEGFPDVTKEQVETVLKRSLELVEAQFLARQAA